MLSVESSYSFKLMSHIDVYDDTNDVGDFRCTLLSYGIFIYKCFKFEF